MSVKTLKSWKMLRSIHATGYQIFRIISICKFAKGSTKSLCVTSPYPRGNFIPLVSGPPANSKTHFPSQGGAKKELPELFQSGERSFALTSVSEFVY